MEPLYLVFWRKPPEGVETEAPVGEVEVEFDEEGNLLINDTKCADTALRFIIAYGLKQYLADTYAEGKGEKKPLADIQAAWAKKLAGVVNGDKTEIGERITDPIESLARDLCRAKVAETKGEKSHAAALKKYGKEKCSKWFKAVFAANGDTFRKTAKDMIERQNSMSGIVVPDLD